MGNTKLKRTPLTGILGMCLLFCLLFTNFFGLYSKEIRADKVYSLSIETVSNGEINLVEGDSIRELTLEGEDNPYYYEFPAYESVAFTSEPKEGYYLQRIIIYNSENDEQIEDIAVDFKDGIYSFVMPAKNIRITPVFLETEVAEYKENKSRTVRDNSTTGYILNNLDQRYARPEKILAYDLMQVDQTFMDRNIARPDADLMAMFSTTQEENEYYTKAILQQHQHTAFVYNTDDESEYAVALVNPNVKDLEIETKDAVFCEANFDGVVLDGCIYDYSTGIAYIPKKHLLRDGIIHTVKVQLVQYIAERDAATSVDVDIYVSGYDELISGGKATSDVFTDYFKIVLTEDQAVREALTIDDIAVSKDGIEGLEIEGVEYDASTGELTIPVPPATIKSIQIDIKKPGIWESFVKGLQGFGEGVVNWFSEVFTGQKVEAGLEQVQRENREWKISDVDALWAKYNNGAHMPGIDSDSSGANIKVGYTWSNWAQLHGFPSGASVNPGYNGQGSTYNVPNGLAEYNKFISIVQTAQGNPDGVSYTTPPSPASNLFFAVGIYDSDINIEGITMGNSMMGTIAERSTQIDAKFGPANSNNWITELIYQTPARINLNCAHGAQNIANPSGNDQNRAKAYIRVVKMTKDESGNGVAYIGICTNTIGGQTGAAVFKINFTSDTPGGGKFRSNAVLSTWSDAKSKTFTDEEYDSWDKSFTIKDTYTIEHEGGAAKYKVKATLYRGDTMLQTKESGEIEFSGNGSKEVVIEFPVTGVSIDQNSTARYNVSAELYKDGTKVEEHNQDRSEASQRVDLTRGDAPPPEPVEEDHEEVDVHIDVEGEFAWEEEYHYPAEVKLYKSSLTTGNEYFDRLIADSFNYTGMTFGVYTDPACTQPAKQQIGPYLVRVDETANHETETTTTTTTRWKTLDGVEVPGSRSETVVGPETTYDGPSRRIPADYDAAVAQIDPDGDTPGTGNGDIATFTTTTVDDYMGESNTVSLKAYGGATYYIKETNVNEAITGHVAPAQPVWEVTIENNQVKINIGSLEYAECSHGEHESYTNFSYEEGEIQGQAPDIFSIGGPGTNGGVDNIPSYNPFGLLIQKADDERQFDLVGADNALFTATGSTNNAPRPQGNGSLAGAVFKLDLEMKLWRNGAMAHKATFYLQTDAKGQILLHPNYQAENYPEPDCEGGWNTFYIDGGYYLPTTISDLVKATVTEVRAPEGYNLPVKRTWGPFVVWKDDPSAPAATTQSYLKGLNETLRNDFRDISYDIYF